MGPTCRRSRRSGSIAWPAHRSDRTPGRRRSCGSVLRTKKGMGSQSSCSTECVPMHTRGRPQHGQLLLPSVRSWMTSRRSRCSGNGERPWSWRFLRGLVVGVAIRRRACFERSDRDGERALQQRRRASLPTARPWLPLDDAGPQSSSLGPAVRGRLAGRTRHRRAAAAVFGSRQRRRGSGIHAITNTARRTGSARFRKWVGGVPLESFGRGTGRCRRGSSGTRRRSVGPRHRWRVGEVVTAALRVAGTTGTSRARPSTAPSIGRRCDCER